MRPFGSKRAELERSTSLEMTGEGGRDNKEKVLQAVMLGGMNLLGFDISGIRVLLWGHLMKIQAIMASTSNISNASNT